MPTSYSLPYTLILCKYDIHNPPSDYRKRELKDRLERIIPSITKELSDGKACNPFHIEWDLRMRKDFPIYEYKGKAHYGRAERGLAYLYKNMCTIKDRDNDIININNVRRLIEKDIPVKCRIIIGDDIEYTHDDKETLFSERDDWEE